MHENNAQFFGLPGSGKTTILKELLHSYPDAYESIPSFSKKDRYLLSLRFMVRFPRIAFLFFSFLFKNNKKLWSYLLHLTSLSFASHMYGLLHKEKSKKTFLIDEGLFQRLLSVVDCSLSEHGVRKIIRKLQVVPGVVVSIYGGDFDRFLYQPDRMINPRNKLGSTYVAAWSERLTKNFKLFIEILHTSKIYIGIDNTEKKDIKEITTLLHEKLTNLP